MEQPMRQFEQIEYDSQVMELFIADENGSVIGRPFLTALVDAHTRYIIGYGISLNPPSTEKTLRTLKRSLHSD